MRVALRWCLGLTAVASAYAVWWPRNSPEVIAAADRPLAIHTESRLSGHDREAMNPFPPSLPEFKIEPARRDPFAGASPPTTKSPIGTAVSKTQTTAEIEPALPTQPKAPPPTARYLGAIVNPEGVRIVMLARGDSVVPIEVGTPLGDGYIVQSIGINSVTLIHPQTSSAAEVSIPGPGPTF